MQNDLRFGGAFGALLVLQSSLLKSSSFISSLDQALRDLQLSNTTLTSPEPEWPNTHL